MSNEPRTRNRRRKYVVNRDLQVMVTLHLTAVMVGMGALYVVALSLLPAPDMSELSPEQLRSFMLKAGVLYFALATAIVGMLAIIVTHRIAGPAFVIERALLALRQGDYTARLSLRRRDHLKGLAALVAGLRNDLRVREGMVRDLMRSVTEGDLETARALVDQLGGTPEPNVVEEAVADTVA